MSLLSNLPSSTGSLPGNLTPPAIPSIRLISATPLATGVSSSHDSALFHRSLEDSWEATTSNPSSLTPKSDADARRRLVPKKSKLGLLRTLSTSKKERDLSDVVRPVGVVEPVVAHSNSASTRGGFEIYMDPTEDPDIGEIVMIKKKKSRAALDGMQWGALGEVTNVPKVPKEEVSKDRRMRVKSEEKDKDKWWSIGRGRKDSKEKKGKESKISSNSIEYMHDPQPRSKTPDPFKPILDTATQGRARFNSLDSGILLNGGGVTQAPMSIRFQDQGRPTLVPMPPLTEDKDADTNIKRKDSRGRSSSFTLSRSASLMSGKLPTPPSSAGGQIPACGVGPGSAGNSTASGQFQAQQGSIALRAMRSVRSLAKIGSWAQLRGSGPAPAPADEDGCLAQGAIGTIVEKEEKEAKTKERKKKKKTTKENLATDDKEKEEKKKSVKKRSTKKDKEEKEASVKPKKEKKEKSKEKAATVRMSSSGPEVDASTSSLRRASTKTLGAKKHSILGLGLPTNMTLRLPSVRSGSTSSSKYELRGTFRSSSTPSVVVAAAAAAAVAAPPSRSATPSGAHATNPNDVIANIITANRRSVESARQSQAGNRPPSALSSASSIRPSSATSRLSSASSGASVKWDEEGLETVRELRKKDREVRGRQAEKEREANEADKERKDTSKRRTSKESHRTSERRRRTPLALIFPDVKQDEVESGQEMMPDFDESFSCRGDDLEYREEENQDADDYLRDQFSYPILTIEEATADGHEMLGHDDVLGGNNGSLAGDETIGERQMQQQLRGWDKEIQKSGATPARKAMARPVSEHLLGRSRPKPMYEDEEGVLSILDAATDDLALLINNLDLQATPTTPDLTPLRPAGSPSPSPTPVSTLAKVKSKSKEEHDGSPKKRKVTDDSSLGAKSVKNILLRKSSLLSRQTSTASISSLRPYAQSRGHQALKTTGSSTSATMQTAVSNDNGTDAALVSKQIAPWATLIKSLSPVKEKPSAIRTKAATSPPSTSTFRPGHKRTMTPAPEPEPEPVLLPLRPAKSRVVLEAKLLQIPGSPADNAEDDFAEDFPRAPSSLTFGSRSSSGSLTPVFKRIQEYEKRSSPAPVENHASVRSSRVSRSSYGSQLPTNSLSYQSDADDDLDFSLKQAYRVPITAREKRKVLGMSGTMGGSDVSWYQPAEHLDVSDPDSDVPDELRHILASATEDDSMTSIAGEASMDVEVGRSLASQLRPPALSLDFDLPVFRASLMDEQDKEMDIDSPTSDEDTKKSFDFTGELKKLTECGGSDRSSFVEQLENAFRTPAKVDLRYDFGRTLMVEVPPVPELPIEIRRAIDDESNGSTSNGNSGFDGLGSASQLVDVRMAEQMGTEDAQSDLESESHLDMFSASRIVVDIKEPTVLQVSDSLDSADNTEDLLLRIFSTASKPDLATLSSSHTSDGELNTSFRFGGLPRPESFSSLPKNNEPLTLSDIIPPPSHVRSISGSRSFMSDSLEDDSVLRSIYAEMMNTVPVQRPRVNSDSSIHQSVQHKRRSIYKAASRPTSGISFDGFDSFEEVRRGFEFNNDRPAFYPPSAASAARRRAHRRRSSVLSIASVSSYGQCFNNGSSDPFDYGLSSLRERPTSEDMTSASFSMIIDDTFAFLANKRRRVESDASSFYSRPTTSRDRRRESNMSVLSQAPPVSLYNRSYAQRRDSTTSASSVAVSYVKHVSNGGMSAWAKQHNRQSVDSVMSDFSAMNLSRPGLGDKMFDTQASSFDSIIDGAQRTSYTEDSLVEKTGHRSSACYSDSVFGNDSSHQYRGGLLPPHQFRPLSVISRNSVHSTMQDDDTMISMLGGGHVRRRSVSSIIEASPCVRVEKRKHPAAHMYKGFEHYEAPNKASVVEKPPIAPTSSYQFGGERMTKAQHGLLERRSLEDNCLSAEGEEPTSAYVPVFSRPGPAGRSRSSTCTSSSSGCDTPPLSASDGASISEGSQSSIDLSEINIALSNANYSMSNVSRNRTRARAPGTGHRRRYSKTVISRSSVYETIEEEISNSAQTSPTHSLHSKKSSPMPGQGVVVVDSDTASVTSKLDEPVWNDEHGIVTLRRYYALRDEAQETVTESRRQWRDTPFSVFAVQSFQAPGSPADMQALLQHSVQNYGPLPSELRPQRIRSRTSSRVSPYPQRTTKATLSPEQPRTSTVELDRTAVFREVVINKNVNTAAPFREVFKAPVKDVEPKRENSFGLAKDVRPRVASNAKRSALGSSKRGTSKSSSDQKENVVGTGAVMTSGDTLRLNRPRPRGRPTPAGRTTASQSRPIRI